MLTAARHRKRLNPAQIDYRADVKNDKVVNLGKIENQVKSDVNEVGEEKFEMCRNIISIIHTLITLCSHVSIMHINSHRLTTQQVNDFAVSSIIIILAICLISIIII